MPRSNFNRPVKSGKSQRGSSGTNVVDFKRRKMKVGKKISKGNETKIKVSFGKINMPVQTIRSRFDGEKGNTNTDEDYVDPEEAKYYQDKYWILISRVNFFIIYRLNWPKAIKFQNCS